MNHWTEAAIAQALEGRYYLTDGKCRNEERAKGEAQKKAFAMALRAHRREQVVEVIETHGTHSPAAIIAAVSHAHGVGTADVVSHHRSRHIIHARQHACFLMRELTGLSFQQIADAVGLVDHSTVVHSVITWKRRGHVYSIEDKQAREMLGVQQ